MKYRNRKNKSIIDAVKWTGSNMYDIIKFSEGSDAFVFPCEQDFCIIETLEGSHTCSKNDWIIKGVKGEYYPCKPDIFEETYEEVPNTQTLSDIANKGGER